MLLLLLWNNVQGDDVDWSLLDSVIESVSYQISKFLSSSSTLQEQLLLVTNSES
jgi:hypothetical protein